jgi:hypothetical protein
MSKWDVGSVLFSLSAQYAERSLRLTKELMRCRNPKRTTYEVAPLFSYEKLEIAEIDDSNKSQTHKHNRIASRLEDDPHDHRPSG